MTRRPLARIVVALALGAGLAGLLGGPAAGAAGPAVPGPTAKHPFQGLRRLTVATIPPVPGMRFAVDGTEFVADSHGVASTVITKAQREAVRNARDQHLSVVTPVSEYEPGVRAHFSGWSGKGQYRGGPVPEEYQRATFNIEYLTSFSFATPDGSKVASRTVDTMRLRSSTGSRMLLHRFGPVWLTGSLAATGHNGLQVRGVSYAVDDVVTQGATVVHRAQERFFPSRQKTVTIPLLLFDVQFVVHDAFFGSATGSAINLEFPDGTARRFPLDRHGAVTVPRLPRGSYQARVVGAGPGFSQKLTVSNGAPVALDALTWLDTALLVGFVLLVLVALLLAGRSLRRRSRRRGTLDLVDAEHVEEPEPQMAGSR